MEPYSQLRAQGWKSTLWLRVFRKQSLVNESMRKKREKRKKEGEKKRGEEKRGKKKRRGFSKVRQPQSGKAHRRVPRARSAKGCGDLCEIFHHWVANLVRQHGSECWTNQTWLNNQFVFHQIVAHKLILCKGRKKICQNHSDHDFSY